jgi:hypothetical protein
MNTKEEQELRWSQLMVRTNKEGVSDDHMIETYVALPMAMHAPDQYGYQVDFENKFVAFTVDAGGVDQEVRLPFELVADMNKWIDDGPKKS